VHANPTTCKEITRSKQHSKISAGQPPPRHPQRRIRSKDKNRRPRLTRLRQNEQRGHDLSDPAGLLPNQPPVIVGTSRPTLGLGSQMEVVSPPTGPSARTNEDLSDLISTNPDEPPSAVAKRDHVPDLGKVVNDLPYRLAQPHHPDPDHGWRWPQTWYPDSRIPKPGFRVWGYHNRDIGFQEEGAPS
jgi:hypothetical protein